MNKIIVISGKKQSGKTTAASFIQMYYESKIRNWPCEIVFDYIDQRLKYDFRHPYNIRVNFKENTLEYWDLYRNTIDHEEPRSVYVYNFADKLKELCIDLLNLSHEQVNGTNEQKSALTNYLWEKMPKEVNIHNKTGPMSSREILQVFGTNIMRAFFDDKVWVNGCINQIKKHKPKIAVIADCRFKSEVEELKKLNNVYFVRLERNPYPNDTHVSEIDLDDYKWDEIKDRTLIIPSSIGIEDKNKKIKEYMDQVIKI